MGAGTAWTPEEDEMLGRLVDEYGPKRWSVIALELQTKGSKQCRRRWKNFLNADIKKGGWTEEEDRILIEGHRQHGNKWTEIAKEVGGRTDNAVKNRWAALMKRKERMAAAGGAVARVVSSTDSPSTTSFAQHVHNPRLPNDVAACMMNGPSRMGRAEASPTSVPQRRQRFQGALSIAVAEPTWQAPEQDAENGKRQRLMNDSARLIVTSSEPSYVDRINRATENFEAIIYDDEVPVSEQLNFGSSQGCFDSFDENFATDESIMAFLKTGLSPPRSRVDTPVSAKARHVQWEHHPDSAPTPMHEGHVKLLRRIMQERMEQQAAAPFPRTEQGEITSVSMLMDFPQEPRRSAPAAAGKAAPEVVPFRPDAGNAILITPAFNKDELARILGATLGPDWCHSDDDGEATDASSSQA